MIDDVLARGSVLRRSFRVLYEDGCALSLLYEHGHVLDRHDRDTGVDVIAEVSAALAEGLGRYRCRSAPDERNSSQARPFGSSSPA